MELQLPCLFMSSRMSTASCTDTQHRELHGPELEGVCVLPRAASPLPQPAHLDTAVILDFHILDFLPSVDM